MKLCVAVFCLFLTGCFRDLSARELDSLRRADSNPLRSLQFSEDSVPGTNLRIVARQPSAEELIQLVYQEKTEQHSVEATYCAPMAVTKAAMRQFGVDGVALTIAPDASNEGGLTVTLRNGAAIHLNQWQLEFVRHSVSFGPSDNSPQARSDRRIQSLKDWFHFYFTVAAARVAAASPLVNGQTPRPHVPCPSGSTPDPDNDRLLFRAALDTITNGFNSREAPALLGLAPSEVGWSHTLREPSFRRLKATGGMIWTSSHVMFATGVTLPDDSVVVADRWGQPMRVDEPIYHYLLLGVPSSETERAGGELHLTANHSWDPDLSPNGFVCRTPTQN